MVVNGSDASADDLRALLSDVAAGRTTVDQAADSLAGYGLTGVGDFACLDIGRAQRKGVPEIVFGDGKTVDQFAAIVAAFLTRATVVLASKVSAEQVAAVATPPGAPRSGTNARACSSCAAPTTLRHGCAARSACWPVGRATPASPTRRSSSVARWASRR